MAIVAIALSLVLVCLTYTVEGCGFETTALSGIIKSPNYPYPYPNNMRCDYVIRAPSHHRITVTLVDVWLEYEHTCRYDSLQFHEGDKPTSQFLDGRHCRLPTIKHVRSFGNVMLIRFVSNNIHTFRGFYLTYQAALLEIPFLLVSTSLRSGASGSSYITRLDPQTGSNNYIPMTHQPADPRAVTYDPVTRKVYWLDQTKPSVISSVPLEGGDHSTVFSAGNLGSLRGLALDHEQRLLFYSDGGRQVIGQWNLDTRTDRYIVSSNVSQRISDIALSATRRTVFWLDGNSIHKADYDGDHHRTLLDIYTSEWPPRALTVDDHNGRIYWVGGDANRIESSDLDGDGIQIVKEFTETHHFFTMAVIQDVFYLGDWNLQRADVIRAQNPNTTTRGSEDHSIAMFAHKHRFYGVHACIPPGFNLNDKSWRTTEQPASPPTPSTTVPNYFHPIRTVRRYTTILPPRDHGHLGIRRSTVPVGIGIIAALSACVVVGVVVAILCYCEYGRRTKRAREQGKVLNLGGQTMPPAGSLPPQVFPAGHNQNSAGAVDDQRGGGQSSVFSLPHTGTDRFCGGGGSSSNPNNDFWDDGASGHAHLVPRDNGVTCPPYHRSADQRHLYSDTTSPPTAAIAPDNAPPNPQESSQC